jgi:hypothetical protein
MKPARRIIGWVFLVIWVHVVGSIIERTAWFVRRISSSKFAEHVRITGRLAFYASGAFCAVVLAWQVHGWSSSIFMMTSLAVLLTGFMASLWSPSLRVFPTYLTLAVLVIEGMHFLARSQWIVTSDGFIATIVAAAVVGLMVTARVIGRQDPRDPGVEFAPLR